jgi:hypothetical protein
MRNGTLAGRRADQPSSGGPGETASFDRAQITGEWLVDLAIIDMGQGIRLP